MASIHQTAHGAADTAEKGHYFSLGAGNGDSKESNTENPAATLLLLVYHASFPHLFLPSAAKERPSEYSRLTHHPRL